MKLEELEFILNNHVGQSNNLRRRILKNGQVIGDLEKLNLSLTLNPKNADDAFIIRHMRGRRKNASLLRILLLSHFRIVEAAENVK